ncbi:MAG: hypothetical protein DRO88_00960 [Promethearchaeia archaeon]|nr:MAG: hypothetical protein DRO88_00960 [Candidatus Lokiarchaeia archaeon]
MITGRLFSQWVDLDEKGYPLLLTRNLQTEDVMMDYISYGIQKMPRLLIGRKSVVNLLKLLFLAMSKKYTKLQDLHELN